MNNKILYLLLLAGGVFLLSQCKEDLMSPIDHNTTPPGVVTNVKVENQAGQARISYALPSDQDLLYVKAVYPLKSGAQREVKSSYYNNYLIADGFGDTLQHQVKLYAVNRSEVASKPDSVTVKPLENPIWGIRRSLQVLPDFAGVSIQANNPQKANVAISVLVDSLGKGKYLPLSNIYTSTAQINQTIRGLDTIPMRFAVTVRDNFLNYTDTLRTTSLTPYYEQMIPWPYEEVYLPGDVAIDFVGSGMNESRMWSGDIWTWIRCMTQETSGPQWITFGIRAEAHLSRIVIWCHVDANPYVSGSPQTLGYNNGDLHYFEIWGSANPNPDGSWDSSWIKLGSFENIKPSGLPWPEISDEDYAAEVAGFNYNFRTDVPKVRYLRIKSLQNWGGAYHMDINQVKVYGDPR